MTDWTAENNAREFVERHLAKGGWWRFRYEHRAAAFRMVCEGKARWRARHRPVGGFTHTVAFEFAAVLT